MDSFGYPANRSTRAEIRSRKFPAILVFIIKRSFSKVFQCGFSMYINPRILKAIRKAFTGFGLIVFKFFQF
jgi:hypothetical protein